MDSGTREPVCPCCRERPRHRTKSGQLRSYCSQCSTRKVSQGAGYAPASRPCSGCGNAYRGNSRSKSSLCPSCRTHCVTCGESKNPRDTHAECFRCRATGSMCCVCGTNPRAGLKSKCWTCYHAEVPARTRKFNLAPSQYDQMLEEQRGLCAICLNPERQVNKKTGEPLALSVDHDRACCPGDRSCGQCIRGLTCRNCNVMLGMARDDSTVLRAAADYLDGYQA